MIGKFALPTYLNSAAIYTGIISRDNQIVRPEAAFDQENPNLRAIGEQNPNLRASGPAGRGTGKDSVAARNRKFARAGAPKPSGDLDFLVACEIVGNFYWWMEAILSGDRTFRACHAFLTILIPYNCRLSSQFTVADGGGRRADNPASRAAHG